MSKAITEIAIGVAIVAGTLLAGPVFRYTIGATLISMLISAGASLTLSGIGTLLSHGPLQGQNGNIRNPISPWVSIYGRAKAGGTIVFLLETGESDKYLHLVLVLACHPCEAIDYLLFDNQRVTLNTSGNSLSYQDSTSVIASNQTVDIASISRVNDVVTVVLSAPFPAVASTAAGETMIDGDQIAIHDVTTDATLNGIFPIAAINSTTFTFTSGGSAVTITGEGQATTTFPDYGDTVHMEVALGTQGPGTPPFPGLLATDDTGSQGIWTAQHLLQGKTAVYLRLKYGGDTYASGMPSISFLLRGKNDIHDPRTSTTGYTENSALCIADYLADTTWGFKAHYGTEIPLPQLISAANICDEAVPLANGSTEPRYTCNGQFPLTMKRSEVLQNLLTSCAGRLTYVGGQFVIYPAAWGGASASLGNRPLSAAHLTIITSHTPPGGVSIFAEISTYFAWGDSPTIGSVDFNDSGTWTTRTDTVDLISRYTTLADLASLVVTFRTQASFTTGTATDDFRVYDCYIAVTYADDSTTDTLRPAAWQAVTTGLSGSSTITNGATLLDTSSATYADITLSGYDIFHQYSKALQVTGFQSSSSTTGTVTPVSAQALSAAAGPFTWKSKVSVRDLVNGVKGTYVSPVNGWQSSDFPAYAQDAKHGYANGSSTYFYDANLEEDGGDRRWLDVQLPFTISAPTAQRLAKIELLRRRWQGTGTFAFNLAMYRLVPLDIVAFTLPVLGWSNKLLEVSAHRFTVARNGEVTLLGTELDLKETDPSIYEWDVSEELSPQGYQTAANLFPSGGNTVAPPTNVVLTSNTTTSIIGADGNARSRILVTWTAPADGFVTNGGSIQIQYQQIGSSVWLSAGSVDGNITSDYIDNVTDGQSYLVRLRSVSVSGATSVWVQAGPLIVSGASSAIRDLLKTDATGELILANGTDFIEVWVGSVPSTGSTGGTIGSSGGTGGSTSGGSGSTGSSSGGTSGSSGGTAPTPAAGAGFNTLNFFEDFNTLDTSVWFPGIWYEPTYGTGQSWSTASSVLDLKITPARWNSGGNYADTSILTASRDFTTVRAWKYGYFEARMRWDVTNGAWPAFWLNGDYGSGSAPWMELDIFEGQGNDNQAYFGTLHTWPVHTQTSPNRFPVSVDYSQWHTYGALWTPGNVKFYLDNVLVASVNTPSVADTGPNLYIILSMQMGNDWSEGNTSGVSASEMNNYIDWVKVWK